MHGPYFEEKPTILLSSSTTWLSSAVSVTKEDYLIKKYN